MRGLSRLSPIAGAGLLVAPQVAPQIKPEQVKEEAGQAVKGALTGAAIGAGTKLAGKGIEAIGRTTVKEVPFLKDVRKSLISLKSKYGDAFEKDLQKIQELRPDARVDLSDELRNLKLSVTGDPTQNIEANPELMGIIRRGVKKQGDNLILHLLDEPDLARNLTLEQARAVRKAIDSAPDMANNFQKGSSANWTPAQLDALDVLADIKGKTLASFPELAEANKKWAEFSGKYAKIKQYLREGKLGPQLKGKGGMFEKEVYAGATKPLLKEAGILPEVKSYRRLQSVGRLLRNPLVSGLALGAGGYGLLRK
jgi:hypothetical protein